MERDDNKVKIYIAGPMRGLPYYNFDAFYEAQWNLEKEGHTVLNPAELDCIHEGWVDNYPPDGFEPDKDFLRRVMTRDIGIILYEAEAVYLLPGWESSKGAGVEKDLAEYVGLEIIYG